MKRELDLVVITGMSGAGKTVAIQSLEDAGYFCMDNLPPVLIPKFVELLEQSDGRLTKIAVVVDLRGREFFPSLLQSLSLLEKREGIHQQILFLDADKQTLVRRYKETRRRHPLSLKGTLLNRIEQEHDLLKEIKLRATYVINTSLLKPAELKEKVTSLFNQNSTSLMAVHFVSFGFKHGVPIDADLIFDVRFIPNPHYIDELRPHTGKEIDVYDYVMKWQETQIFLQKLEDFLRFLIPYYKREGKAHLVIGIGCTGGKHRSVAITEHLFRTFKEEEHSQVTHRDIKKGG